jgi:hypothetical protein
VIFDGAGRVIDRDALQSVGFSGQGMRIPRPTVRSDGAKVVTVPHEDDGRPAGVQIHHPDGRVSAKVRARTVRAERRR